jgi:predicted PurR-regulated permease PerM
VAGRASTETDVACGASGGEPQVGLVALLAVVFLGIVATAAALWKGHALLLLLFLAYMLAAAIRPTVERMVLAGVPRWLAIALHLLFVAGGIALLLWLFVPVALDQTEAALAASRAKRADGGVSVTLKQHLLQGLQRRLSDLTEPTAAFSATVGALRALAGFAFTIAAAVYWVAERDRLVDVVVKLVPSGRRKTVRDTWLLIDLKLGAVIRTKLLLVVITASVLALAFWIIGLPYFLIVAAFTGLVEVLPVIGPLLAGIATIGAALTVSWRLAAEAAAILYGLRVLQDYVINPRLFARAVHLPPLVVLIAVSAVALLLGPWWVPLAIPLTAIAATLLDVVVWKRDPATEHVPSVLLRNEETVAARHRRRSRFRLRLRRPFHA